MRTLAAALSLHKPASRHLRAAGIVLLASAAIHIAMLMILGGQWAGPVSLRKPITFGLSVGLLLWTLGWVFDRLRSRPRMERVLGGTLIMSSLLEVGLITVQAWRGVPSHFNMTTAVDGAVFAAMGITVAVLSAGLLATTIWAFKESPTEPGIRLAVRAGLVLILVGLGIGGWMISLGTAYFDRTGHVPDQVQSGAEGVPTFPHAVGLHGVQVFILAAIVTGLAGLSSRTAVRVLRLVVAGYSVFWFWSIVQAAAGRAPLDLRGPQTVLAVVAVALFVLAAGVFIAGWRRAQTSTTSAVETVPALTSAP
ncbi:MAG: hypothetical protein H0T54_05040 [Geodermatophilaceae bacterium]|nr:hypothetical protein [Geodermatophilaceae bacterium]